MILTSSEIREEKTLIAPFREEQLQAASYDIRLSNKFLSVNLKGTQSYPAPGSLYAYLLPPQAPFDLSEPENLHVSQNTVSSYILSQGETILALSDEYFSFPNYVAGKVFAKSSLGRLFLMVSNGDAGWIDPGFTGRLVLEIKNNASFAIKLQAGMRIGQVVFFRTSGADKVYQGSYVNQQDFATDKWKNAIKKIGTDIVLGKEDE